MKSFPVLYLCPRARYEYVWDDGSHDYQRGHLVRPNLELSVLVERLAGRMGAIVIAIGGEDPKNRALTTSTVPCAALVECGTDWFEDCLDLPMRFVADHATLFAAPPPIEITPELAARVGV